MTKKTKKEKTNIPIKDRSKAVKHSTAPVPIQQNSRFNFYPFIIIFLVGFLCYSNTFHVPFILDDAQNIVELRGIHLSSFSISNLVSVWQAAWEKGRPVALVSFGLNYYFGKLNTFGYHLGNLLIHLLTASLVYLFIKLTLNLPSLEERYGKQSHEIALVASLLFVAHPIQTQAVTYIVQRMASMVTLFFMLTLYCYAKARLACDKKRIGYFVVGSLAMFLAFGSKENSVTL